MPKASTMNQRILIIATFGMALSFTIWAVFSPLANEFEVIYGLTATQKSILVAVPVLLGSIMRIPFGILTDRYGGRKTFTALLLFLIIPLIGAGFANSYYELLFWGFFIGLAGTSFAISITFVSKWTPPEKQGTALGINGMGNIGTAIAGFTIPTLTASLGLQWGFWVLTIPVLIMAAFVWFGTPETPKKGPDKTIVGALSVLKHKDSWLLSILYFVTFGAFVAFGIYLPTLLMDLFDLTAVDAGMRAGGFVVLATLARPIGGVLGDRIGAGKVLTYVFLFIAFGAFLMSAGLTNIYVMTVACLLIALVTGAGNGAVFKLVPELFPNETGAVTGVVGAFGGLGGFFPPLLMGGLKDATGSYVIGIILLGIFALVCLMINKANYDKRKPKAVFV